MKMHALIAMMSGLALIAGALPASAQSATRIAEHGDWGTYSYTKDNGKVCYVLTVAKDKQPATLDHGDVYFFVSQRPGQDVTYEPQFITGYDFQAGSKVNVTVGAQNFVMFTRGKSAWVENAAQEPALIAAMKGGADMSVKATSGRGNATSYTFSLKGITAALSSIANCK